MISNFQELAWNRFFQKDLPAIFEEYSFVEGPYTVNFTPANIGDFIKRKEVHGTTEISDTLCYNIELMSTDTNTINSRVVLRDIPLAQMPVYTHNGFLINGTYWTIINECVPASGWYFTRSKDGRKKYLTLNRRSSPVIRISFDMKSQKFKLEFTGSRKKSNLPAVGIFQFLKALSTSLSFSDIYQMMSLAPFIAEEYVQSMSEGEESIEVCARNVATMIGYNLISESSTPVQDLQNYFYKNYLRIGPERMPRFDSSQSFTRAIGCTLARKVETESGVIPVGTTLTASTVKIIEDANIDTLYVRHKGANRVLYKIKPEENITFQEICAVIYNFMLWCVDLGVEDDPDSYSNKVLNSVAHIFENKITSAIKDIRKILMEYLSQFKREDSLVHLEDVLTDKVTNATIPYEVMREAIRKASTLQMLEETNSITTFEQAFRLTRSAKQLPAKARDVQVSQRGRVCPYTTSESDRVGINTSLSALASVDEFGFLCTPYVKVVNGIATTEVVNINPIQEQGKLIAGVSVDLTGKSYGIDDLVGNIILNGEIVTARVGDIDFQEYSGVGMIGPLIGMIPSAERDAGKRLVMAVKAQRQAIPVVNRERAFVTTGMETMFDVGVTRARQIIQATLTNADLDLQIPEGTTLRVISIETSGSVATLKFTTDWSELSGVYSYTLDAMNATTKGSPKHQRLNTKHINSAGQYVFSLDDIVIYNYDVDIKDAKIGNDSIQFGKLVKGTEDIAKHAIALGNNVKVLFKSWEGFGYEDSIIVNEDFVTKYGLSIITAKQITYKLEDGEQFYYPLNVKDRVRYMNTRGLPEPGTLLKAGQDVIIRAAISSKDGQPGRYPSIKLKPGQKGYVISAELSHEEKIATVTLGDIIHLEEGDKLAGTHGNKGVVGRIVPYHEMPFMENGEVPDIILNPLGVLSRSNLGQMTEHMISFIGNKTGEIQVLPPFSGLKIAEIINKSEQLGLVEMDVYDGRTGKKFDKKGSLGIMHFLRLEHIATSKFNACSDGSDVVNQRTMQVNGGPGGGQRISELTSWCINSYGATDLLDTLMTVQSDDPISKINLRERIRSGVPTDSVSYGSNNFGLLQAYYRMLGINISNENGAMHLTNLTSEDIKAISNGDCDLSRGDSGNAETQYSMLRDPKIFGEWNKGEEDLIKSRQCYGRLPLNCEIVMPIFLTQGDWCKLFTVYHYKEDKSTYSQGSVAKFKSLLDSKGYIVGWMSMKEYPEDRQTRYQHAYGVDINTLKVPIFTESRTAAGAEAYHLKNTGIAACVDVVKYFNPVATLCYLEDQILKGISKYALDKYSDIVCKMMDIPECVVDEDKKLFEEFLLEAPKAIKSDESSNVIDIVGLLEYRNFVKEFILNNDLASYVVDALLVPPIGYRPTYQNAPVTAMDTQLRTVISAVKNIRNAVPNSDDYYTAQTSVFNAVGEMIFGAEDADSKHKSILQELTSHSTKQSVMRDTLLAKRITHSGRSVISVNPKLKLGEAGIPISIASKILESFAVVELVNNSHLYPELTKLYTDDINNLVAVNRRYKKLWVYLSNNNINGFAESCNLTKDIHKTFSLCKQELFSIIDKLFSQWAVLLGREPSLHKFSLGGFRGIPVDTYSIQLHPLACHGFNADFDGDQMLVGISVHEKGNNDVKKRMLTQDNLINPKDCELICSLNQDMILGLYYATIYKNNSGMLDLNNISRYYTFNTGRTDPQFEGFCNMGLKELYEDIMLGTVHVHDTVVVTCEGRLYVSTAGRMLFNSLYSDHMGFTPYAELDESILIDSGDFELVERYKSAMSKAKKMFDFSKFSPEFELVIQKYGKKFRGIQKYALHTDFELSKDTIGTVTKSSVRHYFDVLKSKPDQYGDTLAKLLDRIKDYGFWSADYSGITLSLFDFGRLPLDNAVKSTMPAALKEHDLIQQAYDDGMLTEYEYKHLKTSAWQDYKKKLTKNVDLALKQRPNEYDIVFDPMDNIYLMVASGARGSTGQLMEISGIIGNVTNASGEMIEDPIIANYADGLNPYQLFINSYTARRQIAAAQLSTASAGQKTRHLIYANEHLRIRDDNKECSAESACIRLSYDASYTVNSGLELIFSQEDIDSIDESFWNKLNNFSKESWVEFVSCISDALITPTVSAELKPFINSFRPKYLILKQKNANGWHPVACKVTYTLTNKSKYMLLYRCIDMDKIPHMLKQDFINAKATVIPNTFEATPELIAASEHPEYVVIGEDLLDLIEQLVLPEVFIYTIVGCKSTNGICKRCYGIKYDTKTFPANGEYIGYQAMQSIGEPVAQLVLDSHKRTETDDGSSALGQLDELMNKPLAREGFRAVISPKSGNVTVSRSKISPDCVELLMGDEVLASGVPITRLLVSNNSFVEAGQPLTTGVVNYELMSTYTNFLNVQIQFWMDFLKVFGDEKIMARNFECLARSQSEFGIATESAEGIEAGSIYSVNKLLNNNIKFIPKILSYIQAMDVEGKVFTSIALEHFKSHAVYHILNNTMETESTNIGKLLVGDLKSAPLAENSGVPSLSTKYSFQPESVNSFVQVFEEGATSFDGEEIDLSEEFEESLEDTSQINDSGKIVKNETITNNSSVEEVDKTTFF